MKTKGYLLEGWEEVGVEKENERERDMKEKEGNVYKGHAVCGQEHQDLYS